MLDILAPSACMRRITSTCSRVTCSNRPTFDPPHVFPLVRAAAWPARTRSPRISVSYAATDASTFAINRPAGVDFFRPTPKNLNADRKCHGLDRLLYRRISEFHCHRGPNRTLPGRSIYSTQQRMRAFRRKRRHCHNQDHFHRMSVCRFLRSPNPAALRRCIRTMRSRMRRILRQSRRSCRLRQFGRLRS
jgi:hypothetical protein